MADRATCNVRLNPFVASPTRPSFSDCDVCSFFLPLPLLLFSIVFSFFCCCFCCFFGEFFSLSLFLSFCVWRQVGVAAAAWRKVFRFPSGRTYTVSTLPRQLQQYVSVCGRVCVPVCVNGNVAYACFFAHCRAFLADAAAAAVTTAQLRVQPTIDGTAIL